jgi:hypothetical protein
MQMIPAVHRSYQYEVRWAASRTRVEVQAYGCTGLVRRVEYQCASLRSDALHRPARTEHKASLETSIDRCLCSSKIGVCVALTSPPGPLSLSHRSYLCFHVARLAQKEWETRAFGLNYQPGQVLKCPVTASVQIEDLSGDRDWTMHQGGEESENARGDLRAWHTKARGKYIRNELIKRSIDTRTNVLYDGRMDNKRVGPTGNRCKNCGEPFEQAAKGRLRWTCSDACRQALYRRKQGKDSREYKRKKQIVDARRALPMIERTFSKVSFMPILKVSFRRDLYECMACGKPYIVDRVNTGAKVRPYCSEACKSRAEYHWDKFNDAYERAHQRGELSTVVRTRLAYGKMSPLCPRCGKPFAPNTTLHGQRKKGRPRKYCSDACRKEAYEQRWKNTHMRARTHRYHACVNCGMKFDRMDSRKRRVKRHCSYQCMDAFRYRAARERKRMIARYRGQRSKIGNGHRWAILSAPKNKGRRVIRNTKGIKSSGGEWEDLYSEMAQV